MLLVLVQGLSLLLTCVVLLVQCAARPAPIPDAKLTGRVCRQSRLSNGIRVATESYKTEGGRKAKITVAVGVGSRHETEEINGIAHFTEHMLLKGIDMYQTFRLCFEFGLLNGATGKECTRLKMECEEKEDVGKALATLSELVIKAQISDINVERERVVIQDQYRMYTDVDLVNERRKYLCACVHKVAFHPNSLGLFVEGQLYTNFSIMPSDIQHFYGKHYKTKNTLITAVGEVDHDEVVRLAEQHFKDYPKGDGVRAPVAVWHADTKVCLTPEAREVFGMLAVQAPSRSLFKNASAFIVTRLIEWVPESAYPPHLCATAEECGALESAQLWWSISPFKELTTIGRMFIAMPGLERVAIAKLIGKWRYLAYDMTEENLKLAKERFLGYYHSKDLERASKRIILDMLHYGRPVPVEEERGRCEALTLPQFRAICKRLLLEGEFTLVAFGPPGTDLPLRDEMRAALREKPES